MLRSCQERLGFKTYISLRRVSTHMSVLKGGLLVNPKRSPRVS